MAGAEIWVGAIVGGAVTASTAIWQGAKIFIQFRQEMAERQQALRKSREADAVNYYRDLVERHQAHSVALETELDQIREEHRLCGISLEKQYGWMCRANDVLKRIAPDEARNLELPSPPNRDHEQSEFRARSNRQNAELLKQESSVVMNRPPDAPKAEPDK